MDPLTFLDTDLVILLECLHLVLASASNSSTIITHMAKLVFPLEGCRDLLYGESRVLRSRAETLILTTHATGSDDVKHIPDTTAVALLLICR
jgi:hypothetical protein